MIRSYMRWVEKQNVIALVLLTAMLWISVGLIVIGCETNHNCPTTEPLFERGDVVTVRASGERVMITRGAHYYRFAELGQGWSYRCRVNGGRQMRRDGLVSADSPIVAYTEVNFWEFELQECEEE